MVRPISPDQLANATDDWDAIAAPAAAAPATRWHRVHAAFGRLDDTLFGPDTPRGLEFACIAALFVSAALCFAAWLVP